MPTETFISWQDFLNLSGDEFRAFMERGGGQRVTVTPEELVGNVGRDTRNHPGDGSGTHGSECAGVRQADVSAETTR